MKGTQILGGELRGMDIGPLPNHIFARPILARIRKSLFDILKTRVPDGKFLDLFSGSGTVGLEALSRGAEKVVFVDQNPQCTRWIEQVIARLSQRNKHFFPGRNIEIHRADATSDLNWLND